MIYIERANFGMFDFHAVKIILIISEVSPTFLENTITLCVGKRDWIWPFFR